MKKYTLNITGEYRVCAELLRRGLLASVTMGNLKRADIHVVTNDKRVIVVEVKTTESNRFVTSFFQKYKTPETQHPDFWVLCKLNDSGDRFFVLTHREMAVIQSKRNKHKGKFNWIKAQEKVVKGVDNVLVEHVSAHEGNWQIIIDRANDSLN